ncbi:MAG TPA: hypothetical protein VHN79_02475, partial [Lacunisphaera sp.]|nr:hypothetical protein [Lacunisphaera sp.]
MSAVPRPQSGQFFPGAGWWWMLPVLAALVFVIWVDRLRIERVQYVAQTASWSVETPAEDPSSPTGYAGKTRRLIVPGHHHPSYRWIMQAQDLLAGGGWRQHHVAHENFPHGYESRDTSPYRWWLALVAWTDHGLTGRSFPLAVERAALYADPLLHLLLVLSVTLFAGRQFGRSAAVLAALALAALFPLAGAFQPGAPDHHALAWACALWATLPLLAGSLRTNAPRWFALAGVAGGLAYWTDPFVGETFLAGLAAGAAAAIWFMRAPVRAGSSPPLPWRAWGFAGGLTCLAAWLVEYFPSYSWELAGSVNPLPAISWLGLGELLHRLSHWAHGQRAAWNRPAVVSTALAVLAMVALPATKLLAENGRFLAPDLFAAELVNLPGGVRASGLGGWLARDGLSGRLVATLAPLVLAGLGIRLLLSAKTAPLQRGVLALALGPCLVTLVLACFQLRWWSGCQLALTGLLVTLAALPATRHWGWGVGCALVLLPGLAFLVPPAGSRGSAPLDELELQAVVERDLAWWFVRQQGATPTVVFTTPATTKALAYFADIKGVASYAPENTAGIAAATRIASASTWTEAAVLLEGRNITHLLLPSWDSSLEHLARMGRQLPSGAELPRNTLIALLRDWNLPPWLRLLTYHVPP